jgi:hypothetical protein
MGVGQVRRLWLKARIPPRSKALPLDNGFLPGKKGEE